MAEALKAEGNAFYKNKDWLKAAAAYTKAIKVDPDNAVLYSNRSAAFLQLLKVQKALADAEKSISIHPTWEKGYYRKGCALEAMEKFEEALAMFREAAEHNPKNGEVASKIASLTRHVNALKRKQSGKDGSSFSFKDQKENQNQNSSKAGEKQSSVSKDKGKEGETEAVQLEPVASDEDYQRVKEGLKLGERVEYSLDRVKGWAKKQVSEAVNQWVAGDMVPTVTFLPGTKDQDGDSIEGKVTVQKAFESPDTLENCCGFLRQYAKDTQCHASCLVVPKDVIAFPQVWKKNGWKLGSEAGFFVQVESRDFRQMWFVPGGQAKGRKIPKDPQTLDVDTFRILPPLVGSDQ